MLCGVPDNDTNSLSLPPYLLTPCSHYLPNPLNPTHPLALSTCNGMDVDIKLCGVHDNDTNSLSLPPYLLPPYLLTPYSHHLHNPLNPTHSPTHSTCNGMDVDITLCGVQDSDTKSLMESCEDNNTASGRIWFVRWRIIIYY